MAIESLIAVDERGLYCPGGGFYIDPWGAVARAIITHAHGDHARPGSERYLTATPGRGLLAQRLEAGANIETLNYGETLRLTEATVSLHPAGHILGSSQVRIESRGQVCVVSGDYKTLPDKTAAPFEPLRCHHFVSECTFGIPVYRWLAEQELFEQIHQWWRAEQENGRTCILLAYALGKAQRILAGLNAVCGPILAHGAVLRYLPAYREQGVAFPDVLHADAAEAKRHRGRALVLAPPSAAATPWINKFKPVSLGMASGWMQVRGRRRRARVDRGFALSDHADWPGLNQAINATRAERVWLTHGNSGPLARWLRERGVDAGPLTTPFGAEPDDDAQALGAPADSEAI